MFAGHDKQHFGSLEKNRNAASDSVAAAQPRLTFAAPMNPSPAPPPRRRRRDSDSLLRRRVRITPWGWGGAVFAGMAGGLAMPGLPGPDWLVWLAPLGLLAILGNGVAASADCPATHDPEGPPAPAHPPQAAPGRRRRLFLLGWLAGLLHHGLALNWLSRIALAPLWASLLGWLALSAYLALWTALFTLLAGTVLPCTPKSPPAAGFRTIPAGVFAAGRNLLGALLLAVLWLALETGRDHLFGGFNWNGYYSALIDQPLFAQAADLSGALALSSLPVFVASVAWGFVTPAARWRWRQFLLAEIPALLLLLGLLLVHTRPWLEPRSRPGDLAFRALAFQPLLSQQRKWDPAEHDAIHQLYLGLLDQALRQLREREVPVPHPEPAADRAADGLDPAGRIDLLLLPESAYTRTVVRFADGTIPLEYQMLPVGETEPLLITQQSPALLNQLRQRRWTIVSGVNLDEVVPDSEDLDARSYNSLLRIAADGSMQSYDKRHLVPFGEYLPLRRVFFFLDRLIPWNFTSGVDDQHLDLVATDAAGQPRPIRAACLICFEDTIPRVARESIRLDPARTLQLNATNDGWFPELAARQHLAHARWRAIELRRPLLRAGNSGGTAAIAADGSLRDPLDPTRRQLLARFGTGRLDRQGVLDANLLVPDPAQPPTTLYLRWGNWLGGVSILTTLALLLRAGWRRFRRAMKTGAE